MKIENRETDLVSNVKKHLICEAGSSKVPTHKSELLEVWCRQKYIL